MNNIAVTFEYPPLGDYLHRLLCRARSRGIPPSIGWKVLEGVALSLQEQQSVLMVVATEMVETYLDEFVWCVGQIDELEEDEDPMVQFLYHLDRYARQIFPDCDPLLFYPMDLKGMVMAVVTKKC